ncbi:MAG: ribonuclease HIII [Nitrospira sp.]
MLDQQAIQSLWHEPLLLQLNWLFKEAPPNPQLFGGLTNQLKERELEARLVNDLFFGILSHSFSAEDVYKALSAICAMNQPLLPRFIASGYLENIRGCDESPSTKISSFLEALKDELDLNLLEQESVRGSLDSLKHREAVGRAYALLVRSGHDSALMVPLNLYLQPGGGQARCTVEAEGTFKSAVQRAQMALQRGGFLAKSIDVVYSLDLTDSEYTGSSIGLAATAAMFTTQRRLIIDPYTAFTGDVNLDRDEWKVKSVIGLSHKLSAARLNGCRRIFIPQENLLDLQADEQESLQVIGVENVGQILLQLESNPQPLREDSAQNKKQNIVHAHCQAAGWQLSEPRIIQNGVQYRVTPLSTPALTVTIYDSGTHLPKEHPHKDYQSLLADLASLDEKSTPICSRNKTYTIIDQSLRNEIRTALNELNPEQTRDEQHCDYSFEFKRGKERLLVKQYKSGKLQIQGSAGELYRVIIECVVSRYKLRNPTANITFEGELSENQTLASHDTKSSSPKELFQPVPLPHIGTDESGKGDYFGPMVVAGVMVDPSAKAKLESIGVKDSKLLSDKQCRLLAAQIRSICGSHCEEIEIAPETYNRLYDDFRKEGKNLNHLLAWGHARAIESLLERHSCSEAIADQFGDEHYILSKLMPRGRTIKLTQLPKGERYIAVAAASILARDKFLSHLEKLSREQGINLPKGASDAVVSVGRNIVREKGEKELRNVAKLHHKTTVKILQ